MIKNILLKILLVFLILPSVCVSNTIDIYYPNNNTTTDIFYSSGGGIIGGFIQTTSNNVSGNLSIVILNDELQYDNIFESPHKTISPIFKLILLVVVLFTTLLIVVGLKRLF